MAGVMPGTGAECVPASRGADSTGPRRLSQLRPLRNLPQAAEVSRVARRCRDASSADCGRTVREAPARTRPGIAVRSRTGEVPSMRVTLTLGAVIVAGSCVVAGCAPMRVSSHVDRDLDFTRYRTFDWGPADALPAGDPRLERDAFFQDHIQGAIERNLAAKRIRARGGDGHARRARSLPRGDRSPHRRQPVGLSVGLTAAATTARRTCRSTRRARWSST